MSFTREVQNYALIAFGHSGNCYWDRGCDGKENWRLCDFQFDGISRVMNDQELFCAVVVFYVGETRYMESYSIHRGNYGVDLKREYVQDFGFVRSMIDSFLRSNGFTPKVVIAKEESQLPPI